MRSRSYDRQRAALVDLLREKGITDDRVLRAVGAVPRHAFVEPAFHHRAYKDEALPIGLKQTISQPYTVAYQTMLLGVQDGDKILEVGTGSGYQAAVLSELGARVFSIERHAPLLARTQALLSELGYRVRTRHGDGTLGWNVVAPFDGIVVTAGGTEVPDTLLDQLRAPEEAVPDETAPRGTTPEEPTPDATARGGRLVIPVGDAEKQTMLRLTRTGPEDFQREAFMDFRFVPLVAEDGGR